MKSCSFISSTYKTEIVTFENDSLGVGLVNKVLKTLSQDQVKERRAT